MTDKNWNILRLVNAYTLAIEVGNYRAAARFAAQGIRLDKHNDDWKWRFRGAWVRRFKATPNFGPPDRIEA